MAATKSRFFARTGSHGTNPAIQRSEGVVPWVLVTSVVSHLTIYKSSDSPPLGPLLKRGGELADGSPPCPRRGSSGLESNGMYGWLSRLPRDINFALEDPPPPLVAVA